MNDPCEKMQDTITDYILGALNRQELDALQKHLSWCSQCRKYTQDLLDQSHSLGRLAEQLDADTTAREDSVIEALNCSALTEQGSSGSVWDTIIRNKVIKTATAAMVIAALLIIIITGITFLAPEITWADVQVAFIAQKWVHVKYDNGREYWHDLVNDSAFHKTEHGDMYVNDPGKGIRYSYSPGQEDLIRVRTSGNRKDETIQSNIRTAWEIIVEGLDKPSEKFRDLIEKHTVTIDGRELVRFDLYYKNILNERIVIRQLWADPETRLPVRIWRKLRLSEREWQGRDHITGVFEFPQTGPETIYDLGVPPEVKIVNTRQRGESSSDEAKALVQISKENSENFPIRYRAVIWEKLYQYDPFSIRLFYRTDNKIYIASYGNFYGPKDSDNAFGVEDIMALIKDKEPLGIDLYDGEKRYHRGNFQRDERSPEVRIARCTNYSYVIQLWYRFERRFWPHAGWAKNRYCHIIPDHPQAPAGSVALQAEDSKSNTYFFIDPGKDHLCTGEIRMGDMDGVLRKAHETWWFDFEQLPTGHWYPTKEHYISYGSPQRGTSGHEERRNIHIQLLDEDEFPVGIFDGERLKEGAEVKDAWY